MSKFSSFVARAFLWLIGGAFVLGFLYLPLALLRGLLMTTGCFTEVLAEARGVPGSNFEVSQTHSCHPPAPTVYLLKPAQTRNPRFSSHPAFPHPPHPPYPPRR